MKKIILIMAILGGLAFSGNANAQVSVRFNIGLQPLWGPVGYDYVNYYYIPDIDVYYDVPNQQYVYFDNGVWVTSAVLPPRYRGFDLYRAHKVVINDDRPWMHHERYRNQYSRYRGHHDQMIIRDSHENRYRENPGHPEHNQWHREEHGHEEHGHGEYGHGEGHH